MLTGVSAVLVADLLHLQCINQHRLALTIGTVPPPGSVTETVKHWKTAANSRSSSVSETAIKLQSERKVRWLQTSCCESDDGSIAELGEGQAKQTELGLTEHAASTAENLERSVCPSGARRLGECAPTHDRNHRCTVWSDLRCNRHRGFSAQQPVCPVPSVGFWRNVFWICSPSAPKARSRQPVANVERAAAESTYRNTGFAAVRARTENPFGNSRLERRAKRGNGAPAQSC